MTRFSEPLNLPELSVGGGLGVPYLENERAPSIAAWGAMIRSECERLGVQSRVVSEPGRGYRRPRRDDPVHRRHDQGPAWNPHLCCGRTAGSATIPDQCCTAAAIRHFCHARSRRLGRSGRVLSAITAESGDIIVREAPVPDDLAVGDILATPVTGAYGHSMGSNYNKVLRPAVVFVADGDARLVVRRETNEDLLLTDLG